MPANDVATAPADRAGSPERQAPPAPLSPAPAARDEPLAPTGSEGDPWTVTEVRTDARIAPGMGVARVLAVVLLIVAWSPPLVVFGVFMLLTLRTSLPELILALRGYFRVPTSDGGARPSIPATEMRFIRDGAPLTVKLPGHVVGVVSVGDRVSVVHRRSGDEQILVRGINHTENGRRFRPPADPWAVTSALMLAWLVVMWAIHPR